MYLFLSLSQALEDPFGEEVCGHKLELIPRGLRGKKCDTCNKPLIGLLRRVLKCKSKFMKVLSSCYIIVKSFSLWLFNSLKMCS